LTLSSKEILRELITFRTVSSETNLDLIRYVADYLKDYGVEAELVTNADQTKANLFASFGPKSNGGIVLSGHTDVVPVTTQNWDTDPFSMVERDGSLYGRGTSDMKGFLACCLAMVPAMTTSNLNTPIHLAFSYDEEVGCLGVRGLLNELRSRSLSPDICIIGEPTMMEVAIKHKGKSAFRVHCTGKGMHSGFAPRGLNAIHMACDLILYIRELQAEIAAALDRHDTDFDIPHSTLHVGLVTGGEALNIVPHLSSFDFEIRNTNRDKQTELIELIKSRALEIVLSHKDEFPECAIEFEPLASYPGLDTSSSDPAVTFVNQLCKPIGMLP
jgi:acetylornithine deacetylase